MAYPVQSASTGTQGLRSSLPGLWLVLATAVAFGAAGLAVSDRWIGLILLSVGLTLASLAVILFAMAGREAGRQRAETDQIARFVDHDASPSFSTDADGAILHQNRAATDRFGRDSGGTLVRRLGDLFASPAAVLYRLQARAQAVGAAREDVVTRRGHVRLSVHRIGKTGFLWRLEEMTDRSATGRGAETLCLPMLTASRTGTILFMNEALRRLAGGRLRSLDQLFTRLPLSSGQEVEVRGAEGLVRCIAADLEGSGGRREIFLLPVGTGPVGPPPDPAGFESIPVALMRLGPDGEIRAANRQARALLCLGADETVRLGDLVEGPGRPLGDWLADALVGRCAGRPEVLRGRRGGGDPFLHVTLRPAADPEAGDVGLVAVLTDATAFKSLEAQVLQSQKMQAVGQLAGGVAHDFNNLLTAISGHCDLLLMRHDPGDPDFADLQQIRQNTNRAASVVGQLLAFSRKQRLMPEVLEIDGLLGELTHLLNRLVGERVRLVLRGDPDLPQVRADRRQLEQVIVNLVVNARDAMPGGGEIRVETEAVDLPTETRRDRTVLPPGRYAVIRVRDEGEGIAPENQNRIFEPFFTTKRPGEGTGLGLSTAYGIVKQTGGFIFVDSRPGEGAEFSLWFAAHDAPAQDAPAPGAASRDMRARDMPSGRAPGRVDPPPPGPMRNAPPDSATTLPGRVSPEPRHGLPGSGSAVAETSGGRSRAAGSVSTGDDPHSPATTGPEPRAALRDPAGHDRPVRDRFGRDPPEGGRPAMDQAAMDQAAMDQAAMDQAAMDQAGVDRSDSGPTDSGPTDAGPTDAGPTDAGLSRKRQPKSDNSARSPVGQAKACDDLPVTAAPAIPGDKAVSVPGTGLLLRAELRPMAQDAPSFTGADSAGADAGLTASPAVPDTRDRRPPDRARAPGWFDPAHGADVGEGGRAGGRGEATATKELTEGLHVAASDAPAGPLRAAPSLAQSRPPAMGEGRMAGPAPEGADLSDPDPEPGADSAPDSAPMSAPMSGAMSGPMAGSRSGDDPARPEAVPVGREALRQPRANLLTEDTPARSRSTTTQRLPTHREDATPVAPPQADAGALAALQASGLSRPHAGQAAGSGMGAGGPSGAGSETNAEANAETNAETDGQTSALLARVALRRRGAAASSRVSSSPAPVAEPGSLHPVTSRQSDATEAGAGGAEGATLQACASERPMSAGLPVSGLPVSGLPVSGARSPAAASPDTVASRTQPATRAPVTSSMTAPAAGNMASADGTGPAAAVPGPVEEAVILLVEDEAPVRAFASRALRLHGYTVVEAASAEDALELLRDPALHVDLFLTDVVMPGLDGPGWVREARRTRPDVGVIFMSGYAEDALAEARAQIEGSVFIPKPFTLAELTRTVAAQFD